MSYMRKTLDLPSLAKAGLGKRFRIFAEIARHPNGITIADAAKAFNERKPAIWHHVALLRDAGFITTDYNSRNGHVALVCKATKKGLDVVHEEMCRLCQLLGEIKKEM